MGKIRIQNLTNYTSIHWYIRRFKIGVCTKCNIEVKTHMALRKGFIHERNPGNYVELCVKCHREYDKTPEQQQSILRNLSKTYSHRNPIQPKKCEYCTNEFTPAKKSRRFCSNSCSAKACNKIGLALNKPL